MEEKQKELASEPYNKIVTKILDKILVNTHVRKDDIIITSKGEEIKLIQTTQKMLYEETLLATQGDHHSQYKWVRKLNTPISWENVWNSVHNIMSTNETINIIWQQIHLNY